MGEEKSFVEFMARLRAGDAEAASQVFQEFAGRLIGLAYHRLHRRLRPKLDAEDVVQSVFKSFFGRLQDGHLAPADWDELWGLLVVITLRKCGKKARHFGGPGRDVGREVPLTTAGEDAPGWEALAREPTPEEAAVLADTVGQVLEALTPAERRVLQLRLEGFTVAEIGERLGRTQHTVKWVLKRIRQRLRHWPDQVA